MGFTLWINKVVFKPEAEGKAFDDIDVNVDRFPIALEKTPDGKYTAAGMIPRNRWDAPWMGVPAEFSRLQYAVSLTVNPGGGLSINSEFNIYAWIEGMGPTTLHTTEVILEVEY